MSEGEEGGGGGHKLGIAAAVLAAVGMLARVGDDCGRAAIRTASVSDDVGRAGVRFGDDAARGATPADELLGVGLGDDLARRGRPGTAGALPVVESPVLHVVDDAAPGAGGSLEEALRDVGVDIAFEVVTVDLSSIGDDDVNAHGDVDAQGDANAHGDAKANADAADHDRAAPAAPVRVLSAATHAGAAAELDAARPGDVVAVVAAMRGDGTFALGDRRTTDTELHTACAERGVRCVIATCAEDDPGCFPLATGMSRKAAAAVPATGGPTVRSVRFADALIRERAAVRAEEIAISRLDRDAGKVVRSRVAGSDRAAPHPRP